MLLFDFKTKTIFELLIKNMCFWYFTNLKMSLFGHFGCFGNFGKKWLFSENIDTLGDMRIMYVKLCSLCLCTTGFKNVSEFVVLCYIVFGCMYLHSPLIDINWHIFWAEKQHLSFLKHYFANKPRDLRRNWDISTRTFDQAHPLLWGSKFAMYGIFIYFSKTQGRTLFDRETVTDGINLLNPLCPMLPLLSRAAHRPLSCSRTSLAAPASLAHVKPGALLSWLLNQGFVTDPQRWQQTLCGTSITVPRLQRYLKREFRCYCTSPARSDFITDCCH